MSKFEIIMPKMGESIIEATITKWLKSKGDKIEEDDALVEIATDKVDSEIPSPVDGTLQELFFKEGDVVAVGEVIAIIALADETTASDETETASKAPAESAVIESEIEQLSTTAASPQKVPTEEKNGRFYSPLIKSIAKTEQLSVAELDSIPGTGKNQRLTKADLLAYLKNRTSPAPAPTPVTPSQKSAATAPINPPKVSAGAGDTIVEMDRMRKLIADHMVMSSHVSPHVTSYIEVDVTDMVNWRNREKGRFLEREGEKITYTPLFMEATAKALKDFPGVNASVDGYNIIYRQNINIGLAAALPNGNLIVPVVKNADQKNLTGLAKNVNDLAQRARKNKLNPDDITDGTFTITNLGSFDSLTGSPIINQPQVAILGLGVIRKIPAVLETPQGDVIAIRHQMILSLSYDHRVVDGALGGQFLQRVKKYLEEFNIHQSF